MSPPLREKETTICDLVSPLLATKYSAVQVRVFRVHACERNHLNTRYYQMMVSESGVTTRWKYTP
jgi:hypothetical protein